MSINESIVEEAALTLPAATLTRPFPRGEEWGLGYAVGHGPHLAPGEPAAERDGFGEVVQSRVARNLTPAFSLREKVKREAIWRLNPATPQSRPLAPLLDPATAGLPKPLSGELSGAGFESRLEAFA